MTRLRLLVAVVVSLVVAGCTVAGEGTGVEGSAVLAPVRGNDVNPIDRDRLREGGTLTWPLDAMPSTFNAHHLEGALADTLAVVGALLPRAFLFDEAARPVLNTDFVTFADITSTEPQVVTYRINPEAKWYDGTPITVDDFSAAWQALNGEDARFDVASTQGYDTIADVREGEDSREVIVTFDDAYADWRSLFSELVPASTNRDPDIFNLGWRDRPLTTAGPFRFESVDRTAQAITLVRNERWWGEPAKLDRIVYRVIDSDAQFDALANGEVDFIEVAADIDKLQRARATPGLVVRRANGPNYRHITLNGASEILGDVRVRRALALAIDRRSIAEALIGPLGIRPEPLNNHIYMANQEGYRDNSGDLGSPDPARAAAMLESAGWQRAGEARVRGSETLTIRLVIPAAVATSEKEALMIQGMLRDVGFEVRIESVPAAEFFDAYINPGNFDVTLFSWLGTVFPVSSAESIFGQPQVGSDGQLDVRQNYGRVGSAEIDALFEEATAVFDHERAVALGNEIDALIWREMHSLPLYQRPDIVAIRQDLANIGAFGFANVIYQDIGYIPS